jgi:signal transduction histidine kinase
MATQPVDTQLRKTEIGVAGIVMGLSMRHSTPESHGGRLWTVPSSTGGLFEFTLPTDGAGA